MKYPGFLRVLQRVGVQFSWEWFCDSRSQASQINFTVTFCWSWKRWLCCASTVWVSLTIESLWFAPIYQGFILSPPSKRRISYRSSTQTLELSSFTLWALGGFSCPQAIVFSFQSYSKSVSQQKKAWLFPSQSLTTLTVMAIGILLATTSLSTCLPPQSHNTISLLRRAAKKICDCLCHQSSLPNAYSTRNR